MRHLLYHHTSHSLKEPSDDEARKQGITQDIYYKCHEHIHNVNRFKKKKQRIKEQVRKGGKPGLGYYTSDTGGCCCLEKQSLLHSYQSFSTLYFWKREILSPPFLPPRTGSVTLKLCVTTLLGPVMCY